jgi:hypothetical protein
VYVHCDLACLVLFFCCLNFFIFLHLCILNRSLPATMSHLTRALDFFLPSYSSSSSSLVVAFFIKMFVHRLIIVGAFFSYFLHFFFAIDFLSFLSYSLFTYILSKWFFFLCNSDFFLLVSSGSLFFADKILLKIFFAEIYYYVIRNAKNFE